MNRQEKFWDRFAKGYDKPEHLEIVSRYQSIGMIKEYLNKTDRIMDFGCATGTIASSLAGEVRDIYGIDISPRMIDVAKQRAADRKLDNLHFSCASLWDEDFESGSFDMIIAFSVLHVLDEREKIVGRIVDLLKPDGLFISLTPCLGEKLLIPGVLLFLNKIGILPSISCFKVAELETMLQTVGFHNIKSVSLDGNPLEHFVISKKK